MDEIIENSTIKSMDDYFIVKLAEILEEIDILKRNLYEPTPDLFDLVRLNGRIDSAFILITPKLQEKGIKLQRMYHKKILSIKLFRYKNTEGGQRVRFFEPKLCQMFQHYVTKREINLLAQMDAIKLGIRLQKRKF